MTMWIFGYGSLLWYTDFPYETAVPGIVRGFSRRFWQLSPDHRGTPEKPGRTVTLVPDQEGSCWGLAYKVSDGHVGETVEYLNHREKAGYILRNVVFHPDDGSCPFTLSVYLASAGDNPYFTGPTDNGLIVNTILMSHGPSGSNLEYALKLADCVRRMAPFVKDDHLFTIEKKLIELCREKGIHDKVLDELGYCDTHRDLEN
ncbi:hypothetical protein AB6A40_001925 [Gnathostoma spinigerum]|uniref:glutathione-specific gamma-glutamylcyclotransferase n=1 Tax=Gnathostoma spinigerum TaxID=75299 RepID=A0ABD6E6K9_9BILA